MARCIPATRAVCGLISWLMQSWDDSCVYAFELALAQHQHSLKQDSQQAPADSMQSAHKHRALMPVSCHCKWTQTSSCIMSSLHMLKHAFPVARTEGAKCMSVLCQAAW